MKREQLVADAEPKNNIQAKLQQMSESRLLTPAPGHDDGAEPFFLIR